MRTARCLEYVILDQLEFLFPPGSAAAKRLSRTEARAKLDQLREAYGSLYWGLYNEHAGCEPPGCGTLFYPLHNAAYAEMLEGIVRDVIRQRRAYGLWFQRLEPSVSCSDDMTGSEARDDGKVESYRSSC